MKAKEKEWIAKKFAARQASFGAESEFTDTQFLEEREYTPEREEDFGEDASENQWKGLGQGDYYGFPKDRPKLANANRQVSGDFLEYMPFSEGSDVGDAETEGTKGQFVNEEGEDYFEEEKQQCQEEILDNMELEDFIEIEEKAATTYEVNSIPKSSKN